MLFLVYCGLGDGCSIYKVIVMEYENEIKQISSLTKFLLAIKFDELSQSHFFPCFYFTSLNVQWQMMLLNKYSTNLLILTAVDTWFVPLVQFSLNFLQNFIFHVYASDKNETFELNRFISTKCHFSHVNWHKTTMTMTIMMLMMSMLEIEWIFFLLNWLNFRFFHIALPCLSFNVKNQQQGK